MSKVFYDHLILLEEVIAELDRYKLDPVERTELINLADQHLHHHVLNIILTHLPKDLHPEFLNRLQSAPHDQALMAFLKQEIKTDIESAIKVQAKKIKAEILIEITKAKLKR